MALNVKILFPLDHPPISFPDEPVELDASGGELNMDQDNRQKSNLRDSKDDEVLHKEDSLKIVPSGSKKLNAI